MIIHTPMPLELVLADPAPPAAPVSRAVRWRGVEMLARPHPLGGWIVDRLLCTDPSVYLSPRLAPGSRLGPEEPVSPMV